MAKIVKTASGKFSCRVYVGTDSSGKTHTKQFTHSDKRILKSIISEYESAHREYVTSDTFGVCLDKYITQRDGIISPATIRGYKSIQSVLKERYGVFYKLSLARIGRTDVQNVINGLHAEQLSGKYIQNINGLITAVLTENGYPAYKISLPSSKPKAVYEPTTQDIKNTLEAARGTDMEIPILLGIHGLRRSEIVGLKYPEDFNGSVIHVHHAVVYGHKQVVSEKDTKTDYSDRMVYLSNECLELIQKQGYVTHKTLAAITQAFPKLLVRNNIPKYRFHDLRHFFASYMHDQGFSDAQIMKMGGWKTDSVMKRVYRYALEDNSTQEKFQKALSGLTS